MVKTINLKKLIPCLILPIFTGLIAQVFSSGAKEVYNPLAKPPLSPPSIVFPFVWSALYILIGLASYFFEESGCKDKKRPRQVYGITLGLNLLWPLLFFVLKLFTFSSIWIVALLVISIYNLYLFYKCDKYAGYLFAPFVLWVAYATYLNIGIAYLN